MIIFGLLPIDKVELELLLPAEPGRLLERARRPRRAARGRRAAAARGRLLPAAPVPREVAGVVHHGLALTLDPGDRVIWEFDQASIKLQ